MFWIHGGGYQAGAGSDYPADELVVASELSVVVVTINYRLGPMGFLASSEIKRNTSDGSAGGFGIQDQRMAMVWVRDHIAAFGGDGADITIFGESAGGNSVINHLVRPSSFPLYKRAIIQSGTYNEGSLPMDIAEVAYQELLAKFAPCPDLACLRTMQAAHVWGFSATGPAASSCPGPVVDGVELTASPAHLITQRQHNKVPVLMGATRDEHITSWFGMNFTITSEAEFDVEVMREDTPFHTPFVTPDNLQRVKELYHPDVYTYPDNLGDLDRWAWSLGRVRTDHVPGFGACGARWIARSLLASGTPAVYAYSFDYPPQTDLTGPGTPNIPGTGPGAVAACHATDVPFVFAQASLLAAGEEVQLAYDMAAYWIAFSKTGDPNTNKQGLPTWPAFTALDDTIMRLNIGSGGIHEEQNVRKNACDYWDTLYESNGNVDIIV